MCLWIRGFWNAEGLHASVLVVHIHIDHMAAREVHGAMLTGYLTHIAFFFIAVLQSQTNQSWKPLEGMRENGLVRRWGCPGGKKWLKKKKRFIATFVYCFTPFSPLATYLIFNIIFYLNLSIMSQPEMAVQKNKYGYNKYMSLLWPPLEPRPVILTKNHRLYSLNGKKSEAALTPQININHKIIEDFSLKLQICWKQKQILSCS